MLRLDSCLGVWVWDGGLDGTEEGSPLNFSDEEDDVHQIYELGLLPPPSITLITHEKWDQLGFIYKKCQSIKTTKKVKILQIERGCQVPSWVHQFIKLCPTHKCRLNAAIEFWKGSWASPWFQNSSQVSFFSSKNRGVNSKLTSMTAQNLKVWL